jgi:hypothetical protein
VTASAAFLEQNIGGVIFDGRNIAANDAAIKQLALISGGHPRSLEYIVDICNSMTSSRRPINLRELINSAADALCSAYNNVQDWRRFFVTVLLADKVKKDARLGGNDPNSESFRSLVTRGILIDSFGTQSEYFMPAIPELFLHTWLPTVGVDYLSEEVRHFLWQILETRYKYTSVDFETIHMRHIRQDEPNYARMPLNELYRLELRDGAAPAASCVVDGQTIFEKEIKYIKDTDIVLLPNTIYNPEDPNNAGWDRLIVLEAFPVSSGDNGSKRFLLPLFIQNKFSKVNATTMLSVTDVNRARDHCKEFVSTHINLGSEFSLSSTTDNNFILLFVAKCDRYNNAVADAPSNVMFCFEEDLERLYGPTLKGFVSSLEPGHSTWVTAPK